MESTYAVLTWGLPLLAPAAVLTGLTVMERWQRGVPLRRWWRQQLCQHENAGEAPSSSGRCLHYCPDCKKVWQ